MAKGRDKHQARIDEVQLYGKDLARRASRKCELCEGTDALRIYDTTPNTEPSLDTLMLLCERCREVTDGRQDDPRTLRFLEGVVWSEISVVANAARELLKQVDADWARETLEMLE